MIVLINIRYIYCNIEILIDHIIEFNPLLIDITEILSYIYNETIINQELYLYDFNLFTLLEILSIKEVNTIQ